MGSKNKKAAKTEAEKCLDHLSKELVITAEDALEVVKFYEFFNVPIEPTLKALQVKLQGGGVLTPEDQLTLRKILGSDIAKATSAVFNEPEMAELREPTAEAFTEQIKWEVERNKKRKK